MPRPLLRPLLLEHEPPLAEQPAPEDLRIVLPLKTITPVIGGGVEPYEPDEVDVVRVPSIRGMLRWWWRLLYGCPEDDGETLFQREARLWGGVSVDPRGKGTGALKSRVRVRLEVKSRGEAEPAGEHRSKDATSVPSTGATWTLGKGLGYALFPLQANETERKKPANRGKALFTRKIRTGVGFVLTLDLRPEADQPPSQSEMNQILTTLWAWTHLGGIGARTRRGFGALALAGRATIRWHGEEQEEWESLFDPGDLRAFSGRLREVLRLSHQASSNGWARTLLTSARHTAPDAAHRGSLELLKQFRQGDDVGRDGPSKGSNMPGRSRWPEPNLLRLLRNTDGKKRSWDHDPPGALKDHLAEMGAPRAAFGLPIVVKFKDVKGEKNLDTAADATLEAPNSERWASPLLLRPVQFGEDDYRCLVLVLARQAPSRVKVIFKADKGKAGAQPPTVQRERALGTRAPIESLLTAAQGDALAAFCSWLEVRGYRDLAAVLPQGASHA